MELHDSSDDRTIIFVSYFLTQPKRPPFQTISILRNTNFVDDGKLDYSDVASIEVEARHLPKKLLSAGDIILERSGGGPKQPVGRVGFFDRADGSFSFSNFTSRLRVLDRKRFDPSFVHFFLLYFHSSGGTLTLQHNTTGIRNLNFSDYLKVQLPEPTLSEQCAIASLLSEIQGAITLESRRVDALNQLRAATAEKVFREGLRGESVKDSEKGKIPVSWEVRQLHEVASIERGKFSHRPRNDPRFYGGAIPFIQTGDVVRAHGRIRSYTQTLNALGLSVSRVFPCGTIVLTIAANIGDSGILEFASAFPDSLVGITPREGVDAEYLELFLRTQKPEMDRLAPKGTQKNINIQFLRPWLIKLPTPEEQQEIAGLLRLLDARLATAEAWRQSLRQLFEATLNGLMTGHIRVSPSPEQSTTHHA